MSRDNLPLGSPVEAYIWNENAVCINASIYIQHKASRRDEAAILVAPKRNLKTGEVRWHSAYQYEYKDGGGGSYPSLGSKGGTAPPCATREAAAADAIRYLLGRHERSWCPYLSPTAEHLLRTELNRLTQPQQLTLF